MTITALKVITLIEQVDDEKFLRQRELFWAHKLDISTQWPKRERCSLSQPHYGFLMYSGGRERLHWVRMG